MVRHLLSISDLKKGEISRLLALAAAVKKTPKKYHHRLYEKVLLTFFELPSLRTELSFDVAMFQMGGEVIDYHSETSPWAHGKESIQDVARVVSRYCDASMMRMRSHGELVAFAKNSRIPVINGLTDREHPVQILSDLFTIAEKRKNIEGMKLAYVGDSNNNVTHSLILAAAVLGFEIRIACPLRKAFSPDAGILKLAYAVSKGRMDVHILHHAEDAVKGCDVVYTDSWMSYRIPKKEHRQRVKILRPFQVNERLMRFAKPNAIFMHCLPAKRGEEVSAGVIDGKQSVVFDQAENRLHMQKAILLHLLA